MRVAKTVCGCPVERRGTERGIPHVGVTVTVTVDGGSVRVRQLKERIPHGVPLLDASAAAARKHHHQDDECDDAEHGSTIAPRSATA